MTEELVRVRVPAKINLSLQVLGLRDDGFHELGTVFQAVSLFDEVSATLVNEPTISAVVLGDGADQIGVGLDNLAVRAAQLLRTKFGSDDLGVHLKIKKTIPVAGGMAGGSADAAGALLACSVLWDLDTDPDDLANLASELGSDVSFPLIGGTAIGRGRGEILVPLLSRGTYHWVLAVAERGLSTPVVFRQFDEMNGQDHFVHEPDAERGVLNALVTGDARALAGSLHNDLEAAALRLYPELDQILQAGRSAGALAGIVSGSGPTCAFLCASESDAIFVAATLQSIREVRGTKRVSGPVCGAQLIA